MATGQGANILRLGPATHAAVREGSEGPVPWPALNDRPMPIHSHSCHSARPNPGFAAIVTSAALTLVLGVSAAKPATAVPAL